MQGKSIEIIVEKLDNTRNSHSAVFPLSSISCLDMGSDHSDLGRITLHGRELPFYCQSRKLTLARLAWIDMAPAGSNFDDPVANPTMALSMARAGTQSQGLDEDQARKAISPWFTKDEIIRIERLSRLVNDPHAKVVDANLMEIGALIASRSRELQLKDGQELSEKTAARRADIAKNGEAPSAAPRSRASR